MSEMIERVVNAMRETGLDCCTWGDEAMRELAVAAIRAMREPTEAMIAGGLDLTGNEVTDVQVRSLYEAMIDAALAETIS